MIEGKTNGGEAEVSKGRCSWAQRGILGALCALVIGVYACLAGSDVLGTAADAGYNLLVQGFRAGQLSLKKEAPPGLGQLTDPYDPVANAPYLAASYGTYDVSYYKGRLYIYWGVTPALLLSGLMWR